MTKTTLKRLSLPLAAVAVAAATFAAGTAFADHHATTKSAGMSGQKDIVDTAVEAGQFNTLAAALKQAELATVLKGEGPFTVFAPTDEAFANLPEGAVETLMMDENKGQLQQILLYHVVSGEVMAADVTSMDEAETVQGETVSISVTDGQVMLNDVSTVTKTDLKASNGVIHVIDAVLIPTGGNADEAEMEEDMGGGMDNGMESDMDEMEEEPTM